ncbi:ATP-binding domain-containing protein [Rhizobium sp. M1]|uniref:ATP-binding domain-containing protein n=1 Tax=Rhizobium sp. M1 TaxID=2035453 RepID=UPI000BEA2EF4|nr:ATP-binding domain-containing protein [Rhizobium sp. M1]PDT12932.1 DNA/RNA helicase [Rhizobium sp. M1]
MEERESFIENAARTSLDCMQRIAVKVEAELEASISEPGGQFAVGNSFNTPRQVEEYAKVRHEAAASLVRLRKEPLLARVDFEDEDGDPGAIFIAPAVAPAGLGGPRVASLNSPVGSIASRKPGGRYPLRINGREHDVLITAVTKLYPEKHSREWDSINSQVALWGNTLTIPSLQRYLKSGTSGPQPAAGEEDILARILAAAEQDTLVISGIVRPEVDGVTLRQQRIVDEYQDEIFRMPINRRLFLSGPPGTGKTTTLIRRLGQKVDLSEDVLSETERAVIQRVGDLADHPTSWMLFSPTELLKQYVKENFAREGVPASEENIKTWSQYRVEVARDYLGLLNTTNRKGLFVLAEERPAYLAERCGSSEDAAWYDAFLAYFWVAVGMDLASEADALARSPDPAVATVGKRVASVLAAQRGGFDGRVIVDLGRLRDEIKVTVSGLQEAFARVSDSLLNRVLRADGEFLSKFGKVSADLRRAPQDETEDEDADEIFDGDEDEELTHSPSQPIRIAYARFAQLLRTLANARSNGKRPGPNSYGGKLAAWLGENRLPSDEQMKQLAQIARSQRSLRKFMRPDRLIMRSIIPKFRSFRTEDALSSDWYTQSPPSASMISWQELDLLMLITMRTGADVSNNLARTLDVEPASRGILADIKRLYRNQILVDEVTDFSLIQLALMHELAHPSLHSFFVCGDFNQRLTEWGITSDDDFDWISKSFERRAVSISYRQTRKLVALSSAVTGLDGTSQDVTLPDFNDIEGISPVWGRGLRTIEQKAHWLRTRIGEIEARDNRLPSIAVLVNSEDDVEPLALQLSKMLRDINYSAEACKDGKSIGSEKTVRVFDIQHIKGLEFQAAFFMDMDSLIQKKPGLFNKYLYVGATRAATYFGLTFTKEVPTEMVPLSEHFLEGWQS